MIEGASDDPLTMTALNNGDDKMTTRINGRKRYRVYAANAREWRLYSVHNDGELDKAIESCKKSVQGVKWDNSRVYDLLTGQDVFKTTANR